MDVTALAVEAIATWPTPTCCTAAAWRWRSSGRRRGRAAPEPRARADRPRRGGRDDAGATPSRWVIDAATMELGGPTSADVIRARDGGDAAGPSVGARQPGAGRLRGRGAAASARRGRRSRSARSRPWAAGGAARGSRLGPREAERPAFGMRRWLLHAGPSSCPAAPDEVRSPVEGPRGVDRAPDRHGGCARLDRCASTPGAGRDAPALRRASVGWTCAGDPASRRTCPRADAPVSGQGVWPERAQAR